MNTETHRFFFNFINMEAKMNFQIYVLLNSYLYNKLLFNGCNWGKYKFAFCDDGIKNLYVVILRVVVI